MKERRPIFWTLVILITSFVVFALSHYRAEHPEHSVTDIVFKMLDALTLWL